MPKSTESRPAWNAIRTYLAGPSPRPANPVVPMSVDGQSWWPLTAIIRTFNIKKSPRFVTALLTPDQHRIVHVDDLPYQTRVTSLNKSDLSRLSRDPHLTVINEAALRRLAGERSPETRTRRGQILTDLLHNRPAHAQANGRPTPDAEFDPTPDPATIPSFEIAGERWWPADDICRLLQLRNGPKTVADRISATRKRFHLVMTPGGPKSRLLVNRAALRTLADTGHKATPKAFRRNQVDRLVASLPDTETPPPVANPTVLDSITVVFPTPTGGIGRPTTEITRNAQS